MKIAAALVAAGVVGLVVGTSAGWLSNRGKQAVSIPPGQHVKVHAVSEKDLLPVAAFLGDSYTAGTGATSPSTSFPVDFCTAVHCAADIFGEGSTGYSLVLKDGQPYPERVHDLADSKPDMVFVNGGRNDYNAPLGKFRRDVRSTYTQLAHDLPQTPIYAVSPIWDDDAPPPAFPQYVAIVREEAARAGATYLDIGQPLAGHRRYITSDGVHPNDRGHAAIARAMVAAYKRAR